MVEGRIIFLVDVCGDDAGGLDAHVVESGADGAGADGIGVSGEPGDLEGVGWGMS